MQIFTQRINGIAERKILSRALNGKTPNLTYTGLSAEEQKALVQALINEDEEVREYISNIITNALHDAYYAETGEADAQEDREELQRMIAADNAQRANDMQQAMRG